MAILGSARFDVTQIDTSSLMFGGFKVRVKGNKGPLCSFEDSNGDSSLDFVCHFEDDADMWTPGNRDATLTGTLDEGTPFEGHRFHLSSAVVSDLIPCLLSPEDAIGVSKPWRGSAQRGVQTPDVLG